jgi:hypothetical protein
MGGVRRALGRQQVEEFAQLGRGLELRDRIGFLKALVKCVGQTPHRARRELLVLRHKIQPVDIGQQTPGRFQLAVDECGIEDQLSPLIGDLCLPPVFDLALHGFEVSLDPVHSDGKSVNQIEALAVLGQDRCKHAGDNVS